MTLRGYQGVSSRYREINVSGVVEKIGQGE